MATRENQGLQIALIIFLMITVGLAISTYYFFRQAEEMAKDAERARTESRQAEGRARSLTYQVQSLKQMLGVPGITDQGLDALKAGIAQDDSIREIEDIRKNFAADMTLFDDSVPPDNRNYRTLPRFLVASLLSRSNQVVTATDSVKTLQKDKDDVIRAEAARVDTAMKGMNDAKQDAQNAISTFTSEVDKSVKQKDDLQQQAEKTRTELVAQNTQLQRQIQTLESRSKTLETDNLTKAEVIDRMRNESFERPHGQVTWVNMRNNTVYINLGSADALRRQITFSVYDPSVTTLQVPNAAILGGERATEKTTPKKKGSIEVVDILGEHLAECRILQDSSADPLLPGDLIFTPAWRPGERLQFALVGKMDIDGDRVSDRDIVRNLILANGGEIVAELQDNGTRTGKLTVNTRFLVVGERPEESANDDYRSKYTNMIGEAERNGVQQVAVKDLLNLMGSKLTDRTVRLGGGGSGFEAKKETKADGGFRTRPRPSATNGSGF